MGTDKVSTLAVNQLRLRRRVRFSPHGPRMTEREDKIEALAVLVLEDSRLRARIKAASLDMDPSDLDEAWARGFRRRLEDYTDERNSE